jgi:hypothetical protein
MIVKSKEIQNNFEKYLESAFLSDRLVGIIPDDVNEEKQT